MNSSTHIDQQLASRIRKGDVQAFEQLYERYSQRLYGFAFSMLKNREEAKENTIREKHSPSPQKIILPKTVTFNRPLSMARH